MIEKHSADLQFNFWPQASFGPYWPDTYHLLHMLSQIAGKIRLKLSPLINHWWNVTLYVNSTGLTTSLVPYYGRMFEIEFDFFNHFLNIKTNEGEIQTIPLTDSSVANYYAQIINKLKALDFQIIIWPVPVEVQNPIPFNEDTKILKYNPDSANIFWRMLVQSTRVFNQFRSGFIGKCSPVHFFWGSFDLALTRFSGRIAPQHPQVPNVSHTVVKEAYSHEVSSCGFWPGGSFSEPVFYSYAYPEPAEYRHFPVKPSGAAVYSDTMKEFILPYDAVSKSSNPDDSLLQFLNSTYEAAALTGHWDRKSLERTILKS
jgi:hypothetical protein